MDIALKQRLVGASVLVALGVIFIPMLLDGPGRGSDDERRIPDVPDQRFESRLLPVDPEQGARSTPDVSPADEAPSERSLPISQTQSRPQSEVQVAEEPDEPVERPQTVTTPGSADSPATADEQPSDDAQLAAATPVPPAVDEAGSWLLQLGSFGNAANADRLVRELSEAGFRGTQDRVSVGDQILYRVRAGNWSSKEDAVQAAELIGQQFKLGEISVRHVDEAPTQDTPVTEGWMVQVGSFSSQENAIGLRDRLREGGFAAGVEQLKRSAGTIYRVRVGPELDRAAAEAVQQRLKEAYALNGIVVSHP